MLGKGRGVDEGGEEGGWVRGSGSGEGRLDRTVVVDGARVGKGGERCCCCDEDEREGREDAVGSREGSVAKEEEEEGRSRTRTRRSGVVGSERSVARGDATRKRTRWKKIEEE